MQLEHGSCDTKGPFPSVFYSAVRLLNMQEANLWHSPQDASGIFNILLLLLPMLLMLGVRIEVVALLMKMMILLALVVVVLGG